MVDVVVAAFYMVGLVVPGLMLRFNVKSMNKHSVAKNTSPTFIIVASIIATLIGGGATIGISEKIFTTGLVVLVTCLGFVVRDILTALIIVPRLEPYQGCTTVGDIMGMHYGRFGQVLAGIATVMHAGIFLGIQVVALSHLLNYFLAIPYTLGIIIGIGTVALYSFLKGKKKHGRINIFQFGILVIAIPITFTIGVEMVGGFYGLINSLPIEKLSLVPQTAEQIRFYSLLFVFILPSFTPGLMSSFLLSKDSLHTKKALIISAFAYIPYFIMVAVLGLVALVLEPSLQPDMAFLYLVNTVLPIGIKGLVVAGMLVMIISTADSLLHAASFALSHDILGPIANQRTDETNHLRIIPWSIVITGSIAFVAALYTTNIIELSILAYACWLPGMAVPIVASILGAHASMHTFVFSALCGWGAFLGWRIYFYSLTHIDSLLPALLLSASVYFVLYIFEKKKYYEKELSEWPSLGSNQQYKSIESLAKHIVFFLKSNFDKLVDQSIQKVEVFGAPYSMFVLFSVANLCFVPFIFANTSGGGTPKFVVYLRVIASIFSFLLVMKDFWHKRLSRYLPLFWHITLFFCLPYFAISMCLFSSCAIEWVIDLVLTIFILGILVDWKTYISTILLGAFFAALSFTFFGDLSQFDPNIGNFPIMTYAIIVSLSAGALFSRNKERVLMEKLITFKALGGTIAHEMRTPLSSIHVSASGLKDCLPALVDGYQQARGAGLKVPKISQLALESVASIPERMRYICASTLNIIDMLLLQLRDNDWNAHFSTCSMKECVDTALHEYCFRENERSLIDISGIEDFTFYGNRYLVVHILYNLMRNSFTFIQSEKRGVITIWTSESLNEKHLHFCDTAKGISKHDLPYIFDHGFSKRSGGSGVGLHYCRRMMTAMSGGISVNSVEGKYCEFVLSFTKTN